MKKYDDIINKKRPISKRQRMKNIDRAAQFAPFAALTGHDDAIKETERLTTKRIILDEQKKMDLNRRLKLIIEDQVEDGDIAITYFKADERKDGGSYITTFDKVEKIDEINRIVIFNRDKKIRIDDIIEIKTSPRKN